MGKYIDLTERLPEGEHRSPGGETFFVEHHTHKGKRIVVIYDEIVKEGMAHGLPVISKAYQMRHDRVLDPAGFDAFAESKWVGRYSSEDKARTEIEKITGENHPPIMMAVVPDGPGA